MGPSPQPDPRILGLALEHDPISLGLAAEPNRCEAKPNENTPKISQNHENTSEAPIFVLRSKSINARTCHQRDQCRPQVLSL